MTATAAFWLGLVVGDVIASIIILFVLALLHAGKRGDEIGPAARPDRVGAVPWPGREGSPTTRSRPGRDRSFEERG